MSVTDGRPWGMVLLVVASAFLAGARHAQADWPRLWKKPKPQLVLTASESSSPAAKSGTTVHRNTAFDQTIPPSVGTRPVAAISHEPATTPQTPGYEDDGASSALTLEALVTLGLQHHPRLAKASFAVEAARGRAHQAGLFPNPIVELKWDELNDRTGRSGVNSLPLVTQEIITGGKLKLSQAAAEREIEQANWGVMAERYQLLAEIRSAYFDALALQERVDLLRQIRMTGEAITKTMRSLRDDAKVLADIDVLPVEAELLRYEADEEAARAEQVAAYRRLAAILGTHRLEISKVAGQLQDYILPDYSPQRTTEYVLSVHPEIQSAQWGVEKAKLLVQRAKAEPIPNLSLNAGFVRQNQNRSDDYSLGVSASIPLWNKNQGNIHAAEAELCSALQEVSRVENDLSARVAAALRDYASARTRAERYQGVIDKAAAAQAIAVRDQQRNLPAVMVLELQRSLRQARLERLKALGDAWKAAAAISGLTIEDSWPPLISRSDASQSP
jgi:cobalt-zinc-cadmium efflux system outer membrane protein